MTMRKEPVNPHAHGNASNSFCNWQGAERAASHALTVSNQYASITTCRCVDVTAALQVNLIFNAASNTILSSSQPCCHRRILVWP